MIKNFKLDFVGIGAERCATTWIAECLKAHPEVCFSKEKELYFFNKYDRHYLKPVSLRYKRGLAWYASRFSHCGENKLKGEYSPTYLYCPYAVKRIKKHFPEVKIIVSLRDPVKRALSQYLYSRRRGILGHVSFEKALKMKRAILKKGSYYKYLKRYYSLFPDKNIHVILFEDIKNNPKQVLKRLYKFLGLKAVDYVPENYKVKSNDSRESKFPMINEMLIRPELFLRRHRMDFILRILETTKIRKLAYDINHFWNVKPISTYPKMKLKTEKKLQAFYLDDINKLEKLIKRDLSAWKRKGATFQENKDLSY